MKLINLDNNDFRCIHEGTLTSLDQDVNQAVHDYLEFGPSGVATENILTIMQDLAIELNRRRI